VPARVNGFLFPYQREGVSFLYGLHAQGVGGLLADDMGLGKTVMAAVFLAAALGAYPPADAAARATWAPPSGKHVALLVVPLSVRDNWRRELAVWTPLRVAVYTRAAEATVEMRLRSGAVDVLLVGYEALVQRIEWFRSVRWALLLLDEVHRVKNHTAKAYGALTDDLAHVRLRYGLTGTPVQNNLRELHTLLSLLVRNGRWPEWRDFAKRYEHAITAGRAAGAAPPVQAAGRRAVVRLRNRLLARFMLRRDKALIEDRLFGKDDHVFSMRMAPGGVQANAYRRFLTMYDVELLRRGKEPCDCGSGRGRGSCCYTHPSAPEELARSPLWVTLHNAKHGGRACDACPYCITFLAVGSAMRLADHVLLLRPKAEDTPEGQARDRALCAYLFPGIPHLNPPPAHDGGGAHDDGGGGGGGGGGGHVVAGAPSHGDFLYQTDKAYCAKMRSVSFLLDRFRRDKHKTIIFSEKVRLLDCLANFLTGQQYKFLTLTGRVKTESRQELVNKFNTDPTVLVLLMSTKAGGVGLSVTAASRVILFDISWNPSHDLQAQDRAYRLGQRRKVKVYRLLTACTVEEYQYQRQLTKQQLSVTVLDDPNQAAVGTDRVGCAALFSLAAEGLGIRGGGEAAAAAATGAGARGGGGAAAAPFGSAAPAAAGSPAGGAATATPLSTQEYLSTLVGVSNVVGPAAATAAAAASARPPPARRLHLPPEAVPELVEIRPDQAEAGTSDEEGGRRGGGGGPPAARVRFAPAPAPAASPPPSSDRVDSAASTPPSPPSSPSPPGGTPPPATRRRRRRRRVVTDGDDSGDGGDGNGHGGAARGGGRGSDDGGDTTDPGGLLPPDAAARAEVAETQAVTDYLCAAGDGASTHVNTSTDPAKAGVIRAFNDPRRVAVPRVVRAADEEDSSDPEGGVAPPAAAAAPAQRGVRRVGGGGKAARSGKAAPPPTVATVKARPVKRPPPKSKRLGGAFATVKRRRG